MYEVLQLSFVYMYHNVLHRMYDIKMWIKLFCILRLEKWVVFFWVLSGT